MSWEGSSRLAWEVEVQQEDTYEVHLILNVREVGKGNLISLETTSGSYKIELQPTSGPYKGGRNFERILLSENVRLKRGPQEISLSTGDVTKEGVLFDIRSIKLVPVSAKKSIEEEKKRAFSSRVSMDWLVNTGYGIMFHWTSQSVQPDGSIKSYEQAVNEFDVEKFADMVEETGAGYVMFTIGHAESYCPAPIKSWEKRHPGKTTKRDLIDEMANALEKRGVRLICYINGPLTFKLDVKKGPNEAEKRGFVDNFNDILQEIGNRYEGKIAGYWFDSWYQIFEEFPEVPFEEFYRASKVGNKDRVICLNSWIYPPVTPWQDYWAGEVASPVELPENGYLKNGPVTDLPYQALLIMEPYWVQSKAEMPDPRFTPEDLSEYIVNCMKNKGAVTINLGIYQDGTVGQKALQVMREVKKNIRGNQ